MKKELIALVIVVLVGLANSYALKAVYGAEPHCHAHHSVYHCH